MLALLVCALSQVSAPWINERSEAGKIGKFMQSNLLIIDEIKDDVLICHEVVPKLERATIVGESRGATIIINKIKIDGLKVGKEFRIDCNEGGNTLTPKTQFYKMVSTEGFPIFEVQTRTGKEKIVLEWVDMTPYRKIKKRK